MVARTEGCVCFFFAVRTWSTGTHFVQRNSWPLIYSPLSSRILLKMPTRTFPGGGRLKLPLFSFVRNSVFVMRRARDVPQPAARPDKLQPPSSLKCLFVARTKLNSLVPARSSRYFIMLVKARLWLSKTINVRSFCKTNWWLKIRAMYILIKCIIIYMLYFF